MECVFAVITAPESGSSRNKRKNSDLMPILWSDPKPAKVASSSRLEANRSDGKTRDPLIPHRYKKRPRGFKNAWRSPSRTKLKSHKIFSEVSPLRSMPRNKRVALGSGAWAICMVKALPNAFQNRWAVAFSVSPYSRGWFLAWKEHNLQTLVIVQRFILRTCIPNQVTTEPSSVAIDWISGLPMLQRHCPGHPFRSWTPNVIKASCSFASSIRGEHSVCMRIQCLQTSNTWRSFPRSV